ncbi:MAG TPA: lipid A-modifier LpxR family protein [Candidatus Polarisedimenticolia bacterium]|nr:lipid A-modifier LpxR family protein [Candidatus Polarisedimenticolia bacterium]
MRPAVGATRLVAVTILAITSFCPAVLVSTPALAASARDSSTPAAAKPAKDARSLYLFRGEFDNDTFLGSDDNFTAGWSAQIHSRLDDTWHPGYATWIGRVPGLGDDGRGGRVARWAFGIGQMIITPTDVTLETPQPEDAPWAGILTASGSWSAYDNQRLAALQLLVGCMGPCSGGASVQKFIHNNLGIGYPANGWENQLVDQWLGNVNYEYRHKVMTDEPDRYVPGRFGQDLSLGTQAGLGNFARFVWGQVEYRFGWGLPMGFTGAPDPAGLGIMLDPIYVDPAGPRPARNRWRSYFTLVGRAVYLEHFAPADGGETVNGGTHPGLDTEPGQFQALLGYHLGGVPFSFHLTGYHYFAQAESGINGSSDWVNLSFEYRF